MRTSTLVTTAVFLLGMSLSQAQVAQGPEAPATPATFQLDKKGKRDHIDFKLNIKPVSNPKLTFSQFSGRRMLLFYFSAKCPHCQHAAPFVQQLADELGAKGYGSLAMAIKYNSEEDVRGFIRDFGVRMPMMQDDDRTFGENFGVGTIPVIYLINEKGEYMRWTAFNEDKTPMEVRLAAASWPAAKK